MNRLAELQAAQTKPAADPAPAAKPDKKVKIKDGDKGGATAGDGDKAAATAVPVEEPDDGVDPEERCFQLVAEIQQGNRNIQQLTAELRVKSAEFRQSFDPDDDGSQTGLQAITDNVTKEARKVKIGLDKLRLETEKLKAKGEAANPAIVKIQENQHAHLTRAFLQATNDYKVVTAENEKMLKEQTVRRIKLKYRNEDRTTISDEQAEQMAMEVLQLGQTDAIMQQSKDTLAQILETRKDFLRIEQSVRELGDMFNDLATLLNEQGELMDQIGANVLKSIDYVEKGREELNKAKKYQKKSRKKMVWMIVLIAIIFLFVLASVLGATVPIPGRGPSPVAASFHVASRSVAPAK